MKLSCIGKFIIDTDVNSTLFQFSIIVPSRGTRSYVVLRCRTSMLQDNKSGVLQSAATICTFCTFEMPTTGDVSDPELNNIKHSSLTRQHNDGSENEITC